MLPCSTTSNPARRGWSSISRFLVANWRDDVVVLDFDDVVHLQREGRHIDLAAIDLDVAVAKPSGARRRGCWRNRGDNTTLSRRVSRICSICSPVTPRRLQRLLINAAELALQQAVVIAELLLLDQAEAVIGVLAAGLRAVNAGTVVAAFQIFVGPKIGMPNRRLMRTRGPV